MTGELGQGRRDRIDRLDRYGQARQDRRDRIAGKRQPVGTGQPLLFQKKRRTKEYAPLNSKVLSGLFRFIKTIILS